MTGLPSRSLPSAIGSAARALWKSRDLDQLAERDHLGRRVRHLDADRAAPGNRRDDADATARASRARGRSTRFAICRTFTPGAGSTSNCVTTGPVVRPTSSPSTLNVRSASMSFTPIASSSRLLASALRGGGGVEQLGRRQLVAAEVGDARSHRSPRRSPRRARRRPPPSISSFASSRRAHRRHRASATSAPSSRHERRIDRRHLLRRRLEREREIAVAPSSPSASRFFAALRARSSGARRRRRRAAARPARAMTDDRADRIPRERRRHEHRRASATMTHAPNAPNQLVHQYAIEAAPHARARGSRAGGGAGSASAERDGQEQRRCPAKKIIHERSVSDSSRPNSRSACTAGTSGIRKAAGQPKNATSGRASQVADDADARCARSTPRAQLRAARARRTRRRGRRQTAGARSRGSRA